ncbi:MAG: hypothetical protein HUK15_05025, partial [Bacteroidales bacterium]|nr:hypothetical protein [Bacteroidales bacterium]
KTYRNLMITFGVSGLWHGANWTFVVWGLLHGAVMCVERALGLHNRQSRLFGRIVRMVVTLFIVNIAWVLFRANNFTEAITALGQMFNPHDFAFGKGRFNLLLAGFTFLIIFAKECIEEFKPQVLQKIPSFVSNYIWPIFLLVCIGLLGVFDGGQFIYFQF